MQYVRWKPGEGTSKWGEEKWDLDREEDWSDLSKDTKSKGGRAGAESPSPGCSQRQDWTHSFPDSPGSDSHCLRGQQDVRNVRGSMSEQLKCPGPFARVILFIHKDEVRWQRSRDWVSCPPLSPPQQVVIVVVVVIIIIITRWCGSLGCASFLSNFFPSDEKGCVNKAARYWFTPICASTAWEPRAIPSSTNKLCNREKYDQASWENELNWCQLFLFLPSLLMDGMGLVYQEEEKLIDTGFNAIMPGLSGHISSFLIFFTFWKAFYYGLQDQLPKLLV